MKSRALLTMLAVLLLASSLLAVSPIPTQLSYQGRLTNASGTPITGTKNVVFKIYESGGSPVWNSGTVAVTCTDGLFSVILGSGSQPMIPLSAVADPNATLGVTVEGDPELTPRAKLTSAAFAYTALSAPAYLPLNGGTLTGETRWDFATSDIMFHDIGTASLLSFSGPFGAAVQLWSDGDGGINLRNSTSAPNVILSSSTALGGNVAIYDAAGNTTHMLGGSGGDASVILPAGAIDAAEILDEPGIAANAVNNGLLLTDTYSDMATVTITIPTAGYITLDAKAYAIIRGGVGRVYGLAQIDETAGGSSVSPYQVLYGSTAMSNDTLFMPIYATRTYFKSAGVYTFRLEARNAYTPPPGGAISFYYPMIRAMFFPTSYGDVIMPTAGSEGDIVRGQAVGAEGADGLADATQTTVYQVNLRDLELKSAKAEAAAQKAKLELLQAQLNQQTNH